ncbi:hypothetical protein L9F63_015795 [Diploptera punctata]|uniref:Septin-type G domain-containing protein n=1 Tax=Diploptera punctata TaxID=6984 RepID=A0AAD8A4V3_DIPPU|nr:hypothetical protein L9F63_015795 [Diploptera punctata]
MSSESVKTFASLETPGYVGFANLPNQVHRKSVKKGFEFTLMVVGESGLGKSTLVNSLFLTDLYPERVVPDAVEKTHQTVKLDASTVEIEERGVKLRLTVVDTPGYGDAIDNTDSFRAIIQYIDDQFERFLRDESGLNRRNIVDNRIHCCFYFISPFGHGLKPLDIEFMKQLHNKVNIVPVIAKADVLTKKEVLRLKKRKGEVEKSAVAAHAWSEKHLIEKEAKLLKQIEKPKELTVWEKSKKKKLMNFEISGENDLISRFFSQPMEGAKDSSSRRQNNSCDDTEDRTETMFRN